MEVEEQNVDANQSNEIQTLKKLLEDGEAKRKVVKQKATEWEEKYDKVNKSTREWDDKKEKLHLSDVATI